MTKLNKEFLQQLVFTTTGNKIETVDDIIAASETIINPLMEIIVPPFGPADTEQGNVLALLANLRYNYYNNGESSITHNGNPYKISTANPFPSEVPVAIGTVINNLDLYSDGQEVFDSAFKAYLVWIMDIEQTMIKTKMLANFTHIRQKNIKEDSCTGCMECGACYCPSFSIQSGGRVITCQDCIEELMSNDDSDKY